MRIAILSAIETEIAGVRELSPVDRVEHSGTKSFHLQTIQGIDCITAVTSVGKVAAAQTMSQLAERYAPSCVIVLGTAGALHKDAKIGDVVIADRLFQHDVDLRPFRPRFELGILGKTYFHSDEQLKKIANDAAQDFFDSENFLKKEMILKIFGIKKPAIFHGDIATGDQFFSEHYMQYKKTLLQDAPQTLAAEMEGAAIAQVCADLKIPFVVLRFISDRADGSASIDYLEFLNLIATWYGKEILNRMISIMGRRN